MSVNDKKEWAIKLLQEMATKQNRLPKKEDFDEVTRSQIKAYLGPWPRALESAHLKQPKEKQHNKRKKTNKSKLSNNTTKEVKKQ